MDPKKGMLMDPSYFMQYLKLYLKLQNDIKDSPVMKSTLTVKQMIEGVVAHNRQQILSYLKAGATGLSAADALSFASIILNNYLPRGPDRDSVAYGFALARSCVRGLDGVLKTDRSTRYKKLEAIEGLGVAYSRNYFETYDRDHFAETEFTCIDEGISEKPGDGDVPVATEVAPAVPLVPPPGLRK